jgi:tetratricopeptide (TPR) repeat protein
MSEESLNNRFQELFNSLGDDAQFIMQTAGAISLGLRHFYRGTEHLFMVMARLKGGFTFQVLASCGLDPEQTGLSVLKAIGSHVEEEIRPVVTPTPRLMRTLAGATHLAQQEGFARVSERQLLLMILRDPDGLPMRVLTRLCHEKNIDPARLLSVAQVMRWDPPRGDSPYRELARDQVDEQEKEEQKEKSVDPRERLLRVIAESQKRLAPRTSDLLGDSSERELTAQEWRQHGERLLQEGNFPEARDALDHAITLGENDASVYSNRGVAYERLGQLEQAIEDFTRAITLDPNYGIAYSKRGGAYYAQGQDELSLADLNRALEINPQHARPYLIRSQVYERMGQLDDALKDLDRALAFKPDLEGGFKTRASLLVQFGRYDEAAKNLDQAIRFYPNDSGAFLMRATLSGFKRHDENAIADYTRALELEKRNSSARLKAFLERGKAYQRLGRYESAAADFTQVIALDSAEAEAYLYRGTSYRELGRFDDALKDYGEYIRFNPNDPLGYYNRGNTYTLLERHEEALADLDRTLALDPDFKDAYANRSGAHLRLGNTEAAIDDLQEALQRNPNDDVALYNMGSLLLGAGHIEDGLSCLDQAARLGNLHAAQQAAKVRRETGRSTADSLDLVQLSFDALAQSNSRDEVRAAAQQHHLMTTPQFKFAAHQIIRQRPLEERRMLYQRLGWLEEVKAVQTRHGETLFHAGDTIADRFYVIAALAGGIGEVYLCLDKIENRTYALKTLKQRWLSDPRGRELFRAEIEHWIKLGKHPNIVHCFRMDEINKQEFMFLEWVKGPDQFAETLHDMIQRGPLEPRQALRIAIDICRGLQYAQEVQPGIVHRDLKPKNILIAEDHTAKITDFGLSLIQTRFVQDISPLTLDKKMRRLVRSGGTPLYMAPEQWHRDEGDVRTDLYALGLILYEMLTGHSPFDVPLSVDDPADKDEWSKRWQIAHEQEQPAHLSMSSPQGLAQIVDRCLAKRPLKRFQTPTELLAALEEVYRREFGELPTLRATAEELAAEDYLIRGITYLDLKHYDQAIADFNHGLDLDPHSARIYAHRGNAYRAQGRNDEALADYSRAIELDADSVVAYINRAGLYSTLRDYEHALEDANRACELVPKNKLSYIARAIAYRGLKRYNDALDALARALELDADLAAAYHERGLIYHDLGRLNDALDAFDHALKLDPHLGEAFAGRAGVYEALERYDEALADFDRAIELDPSDAHNLFFRALILGRLSRAELGLADLNRAIEIAPQFALAHATRGVTYHALRKYDQALEDLNRAIELDPKLAMAYMSRSMTYGFLNQYDQALADANRAIDLDPQLEAAHTSRIFALQALGRHEEALAELDRMKQSREETNLEPLRGDLLMSQGNFDAALKHFTQLIEAEPNSAQHYLNRGDAFSKMKHYAEAVADFTRALELEQANARPYLKRAEALLQIKRRDEALADLNHASELEPNNVTVYLQRAHLLLEMGRPQHALADQNRALELDPQDPEVHSNRGNILNALGQHQEALAEFDAALRLNSHYAPAYLNRGHVYYALRQFEHALEDYTRAIDLAPRIRQAYSSRGNALTMLGRYEEALESHSRAIELDPSHALSYNNRSGTWIQMDRYTEALADLYRAIELDPSLAISYENCGNVYRILFQNGKALANIKDFSRSNPKLASAIEYFGRTLAASEPFEEKAFDLARISEQALVDFNRALELNPNFVQALKHRGQLFVTLERFEEAFADMTRASELDPDDAEVYLVRGRACYGLRHLEQALEDLTHGLEGNLGDHEEYELRALINMELGRISEAQADLARAFELSTDKAETAFYAYGLLMLNGHEKEGLPYLEKAATLGHPLALPTLAGKREQSHATTNRESHPAGPVFEAFQQTRSLEEMRQVVSHYPFIADLAFIDALNRSETNVDAEPEGTAKQHVVWLSEIAKEQARDAEENQTLVSIAYRRGDLIGGRYRVQHTTLGDIFETYFCLELRSLTPYVLKTLRAPHKDDPELHQAYLEGAAVWSVLGRHPNIVQCFATDRLDNRVFAITEWITNADPRGADLQSWLKRGQLDVKQAFQFVMDICRALAYARHQHPDFVHGLLRPATIRIASGHTAKIDDVGFEPLTRRLRSRNLSSPELHYSASQVSPNEMSDIQADIYALGCLIYEMLTGHPFSRQNNAHMDVVQALEQVGQILPLDLSRILHRCQTANKQEQFETYDTLLSELEQTCKKEFGWELTVVEIPPQTARDLNNKGLALLQAERYEEAIENFSRAIALIPDSVLVYVNRADAYVQSGQIANGLQDYQQALEIDPNFAPAYLNRGTAFVNLDRYDEAFSDLTRAVELDPTNARAYAARGAVFYRTGQYDRALADLTRSLTLDPSDSRAYFERGRTYMSLLRFDLAIDDFTKTIEREPSEANPYALRGTCHMAVGHPELAVSDFTDALHRGHGDPALYRFRGQAYADTDKLAEALADLNHAIVLHPGDSENFRVRGVIYGRLQQHSLALEDFRRAIALDPSSAESWHDLGLIWKQLGNLAEALSAFEQAIQLDPAQIAPLEQRATLLIELKDFDRALTDYKRIIAIAPTYAPAYANVGVLLGNQGHLRDALGYFEHAAQLGLEQAKEFAQQARIKIAFQLVHSAKSRNDIQTAVQEFLFMADVGFISTALELKPKNLPTNEPSWNERISWLWEMNTPKTAEEYFRRGVAFHSLEKYEQAVGDFSRAIELDSTMLKALIGRCGSYFYLDNYQAAIDDCNRALEIDPIFAPAFYHRGFVYGQMRQWEIALADLDKAIELDPQYVDAFVARGLIYELTGQMDLAEIEFKTADEIKRKTAGNLDDGSSRQKANTSVSLATFYLFKGKYEEAAEYFGRAVEEANDDTERAAHLWNQASAFKNLGRLEDAIESLKKAIGLDPTATNNYELLGEVYWSKGDYASAREWLEKAALSTEDDTRRARALSSNADRFFQLQRYDDAIYLYTRSAEFDSRETDWNNLGIALLNLGNLDQAIECYQRAIEHTSDKSVPWRNLGLTFERLDKAPEAIQAFQQAIHIKPQWITPYEDTGRLHWNRQEFDAAFSLYERAAELQTSDESKARYYVQLGTKSLGIGRTDDAIRYYQTALRLDPNSQLAYQSLGDLYWRQKEFSKALEYYVQQAKSTATPELGARKYNDLGDKCRKVGLESEAITFYQSAIALNPKWIAPYDNIADLIWSRKEYGEALKYFERKIELEETSPSKAEGYALLGERCLGFGLNEQAIRYLEDASNLADSEEMVVQYQNKLGHAYLRTGAFEQALQVFQSVLTLRPDFNALYGRGQAYIRQGEYVHAEESMRQAIKIDQSIVEPKTSLIAILVFQGRLAEALDIAEATVKEHPQSVEAHIQLADVYRMLDRSDEWIAELKAAFGIDPNVFERIGSTLAQNAGWMSTLNAQADLTEEQARENLIQTAKIYPVYMKALVTGEWAEYYRILTETKPDDSENWLGLGDAHLQAGRCNDALVAYQHAVELAPKNERAYINLGITYYCLEDSTSAMKAFRQAIECCTNDQYGQITQAWLKVLIEGREEDKFKLQMILKDQRPDEQILQDVLARLNVLAQSPNAPSTIEDVITIFRHTRPEEQ